MGEVSQVCAKISWRDKFIAMSPIPKTTSSPAPRSSMELITKIYGAPGSTT